MTTYRVFINYHSKLLDRERTIGLLFPVNPRLGDAVKFGDLDTLTQSRISLFEEMRIHPDVPIIERTEEGNELTLVLGELHD